MTHLSARAAALAAAACLAQTLTGAADAQAQCSTCPTPTVAYAPVVAAPTAVVVAPRMGLFDRWRLRRWGMATPVVAAAPAYTAAYTPAYTAAYAPAYTAAYAPAYTTAYAPAPRYLTSYAPLQTAVVQTSYMPATAVDSCSTCPQTSYAPVVTTAYAPTTVYRPAMLTPAAPACSACAVEAPCTTCAAYPAEAPCSGCSACATTTAYADQASYAAPSAGCSSCATSGSRVIYATPSGSSPGAGDSGNQQLPTPGIETPAPTESEYPPNDPGPLDDDATDAAFDAPNLLGPANDRAVSAPTVDIHTAVHRRTAGSASVRSTSARPASHPAIDAGSWTTTSAR